MTQCIFANSDKMSGSVYYKQGVFVLTFGCGRQCPPDAS